MVLRQLTYFVRAAELGSISAAALALNVSQPAVGIQIKKLEEELGAPLFSRDHLGVRLTPAGNLLLADAVDILARVQSAAEGVARFRKSQKCEVRLGVTSSPSRALLTSIVEELSHRHPHVDLVEKQGTGLEMKSWIETGDLDLAISHLEGESSRVVAEPVVAQEFCLIGPSNLLKDNGKPIRLVDLQHFPLVQGGSRGSLLRKKAIERLAADRGAKLDFAFGSPVNIRQEVMQALGRCTISFYSLFHKEISAGELSARPIREPVLRQKLYVLRRKSSAANPVESVALDLIKSHIGEQIRLGRYRWHAPDWSPGRGAVEEISV